MKVFCLKKFSAILLVFSLILCCMCSCGKNNTDVVSDVNSQPSGERSENEIFDFEEGYDGGIKGYIANKDGKFGIIDRNGVEVSGFKFEKIYSTYSENLLMAQDEQKNIYIDMKGNIILKTNAVSIDEFNNSVAACAFYNEDEGVYEYGYISLKDGKIINDKVLYSAKAFSEGYGVCCVKESMKYGYIKPDGSFLIEPKYENAGSFRNGLAPILVNGKWGYIDTTGKTIIKPQFDNVGFFDENGYAKVSVGKQWGLIDKKGKFKIKPQFEEFNEFKDGYAVVFDGSKYGAIDINGNYVLKPEYDNINSYCDGLFAVNKDGLWGFADNTGKVVIECQYYFVSAFSEGLAGFQKESNSLCGYIDITGKTVIEPQFSAIGYFHNGQSVVTSADGEKLSGVIDTNGHYIINPEYTEIIEII